MTETGQQVSRRDQFAERVRSGVPQKVPVRPPRIYDNDNAVELVDDIYLDEERRRIELAEMRERAATSALMHRLERQDLEDQASARREWRRLRLADRESEVRALCAGDRAEHRKAWRRGGSGWLLLAALLVTVVAYAAGVSQGDPTPPDALRHRLLDPAPAPSPLVPLQPVPRYVPGRRVDP